MTVISSELCNDDVACFDFVKGGFAAALGGALLTASGEEGFLGKADLRPGFSASWRGRNIASSRAALFGAVCKPDLLIMDLVSQSGALRSG